MKTITFTQNELILLERLLDELEGPIKSKEVRLTLPESYEFEKIKAMVYKAKVSK